MSGGAPPEISPGLQVFALTPDQLLTETPSEAAKPTSWRYLLSQAPQPPAGGSAGEEPKEAAEVATAEVLDQSVEGQSVGPQFSHLQYGWLGSATQRAISIAQSLPEVANGNYELRMFRLPAVYVDAIWLKNNGDGDDLFIPILSMDKNLKPFQAYKEKDFLAAVRQLIIEKAKFNNSPVQPEREAETR
jgi:hypothetical protein